MRLLRGNVAFYVCGVQKRYHDEPASYSKRDAPLAAPVAPAYPPQLYDPRMYGMEQFMQPVPPFGGMHMYHPAFTSSPHVPRMHMAPPEPRPDYSTPSQRHIPRSPTKHVPVAEATGGTMAKFFTEKLRDWESRQGEAYNALRQHAQYAFLCVCSFRMTHAQMLVFAVIIPAAV